MRIIKRIGQYRQSGRSWYKRNVGRITKITVHHTASRLYDKSDDEILQHHYRGHVRRGWPGLSYHFFITPNGNIYQINDFNEVTWHDAHNWDSIGVALEGYFHPPYNDRPTQAQLQSLKELLDWLCTQNPQFPADFNDVYGHRDRAATACPGDNLYPYVTEYRTKRGRVSWGSVSQPANESEDSITLPKDQYEQVKEIADKYKELTDLYQTDNVKHYISGLKSRITDLENQLKDIMDVEVKDTEGNTNKVSFYVGKYVELKDKVSTLDKELTECQKDKKDLDKRLKKALTELKNVNGVWEGKLETVRKSLDQALEEKNKMSQTILRLQQENKVLEDRVKSLQSVKSQKMKIFDILELLVRRIKHGR